MKRAKHIHDELQELGADVLTTLPLSTPFQVPGNYFAQMHSELEQTISAISMPDPELSLKKEMPFVAPGADYFRQLNNNIFAKIASEQEPGQSWSKEMPFNVPENYFDQLPQKVLVKARNHMVLPERKRVPLFRTVRLAASIALILFVGLGVINIHNQHNPAFAQAASQKDIRDYVEANLDDFDTDIIINGLASSESADNGKLDINLSSEEIRNYLDETGWN
ncbi:hypothetical protein [Rurimicrobium arvi]|uniref:Uncharacterized protein n=1 Tax=Rurimicrobium arvi TaxID=2049916 RepID=A0ABP8MU83_9BACT